MMYFQIAVTPPNQVKKTNPVTPFEENAILKLAPFSPSPKIFFENVFVGEVEAKKLIIQNPNPFQAKLTITKLPPAERFVSLSWKETIIEAEEETILELIWTPKAEGSWRDILSFRDNYNVNRNIPIVFKSVQKKVKKSAATRASKSKTTVTAAPAVKKFRSPKQLKTKRSPLKVAEPACKPLSYKCENCENNVHTTTCSPIKKKVTVSNCSKKQSKFMECDKENSPVMLRQRIENLSPIIYQPASVNVSFSKLSFSDKIDRLDNSSLFSSPSNVNFKCENVQTPMRRETYLITSPEKFNDSLEMEKKFDNLEAKSPRKRQNNKFNVDSTPELSVTRKIANLELSPDVLLETTKSSNSFINKLETITSEMSIRSKSRSRTSDYLVQKLLSDSFEFSPSAAKEKPENIKIILNDMEPISDFFNPNICLTETKIPEKINKNNSSTPKELFKPNSTYEISPVNKKLTSPNLSGDTYTMSNISSSSTYAILSPDDTRSRIRELTDIEKQPKINTSSPLLPHTPDQFHNDPNYLNFSGMNVKAALYCIEEEQSPGILTRNTSIRSETSNVGIKRKSDSSDVVFIVSPPKRAFLKPKSPKPVKNINTTWSKKLEKAEKIRRKSISTVKLNLSKISNKSNTSDINTSFGNITLTSCNIDPFLIAAIYDSNESNVNHNLDPFISSTLYYDEKSLDNQIKELKKWLNALLTPPSELAASTESKKVDVAKLWQDCVKKDLIYAPTKEKVSTKYHTNHKLEILRKSAKTLFLSVELRTVLSKVTTVIENKHLSIREDKMLHLDVGLQAHVLTLLLCYNPLWLRIGLETIYNEIIPLESNSDVIGLSTFIMLRFFRCPDLILKNKQTSHIKYLPNYAAPMRKFTLKKFLILVYFLDQAKNKKLISHDPCLFCQDAPIKESRELLLSFSRELLSAVGDVTKFLRRFGYEVSHKQSFIDEFDYAVKNISVDLRDGIRLTKVMEIILLRNDLSNQLRGPAISRLQKIHNVKLALDSLSQADYTISGDITPKDIVDGHREKTLSLLWQIIYKFQAPRFKAAAIKIQSWWTSLKIVIKRRILERPRKERLNATIKIQKYYRSWRLMLKERAEFLKMKQSAIILQRFTRSMFLMKRDRLQYLLKRQAAIIIQQKYKATKLMKLQRQDYLKLKNAAISVQQRFRATYAMKTEKEKYLKLREVTVKIQKKIRSKQIAKEQRNEFLGKRTSAIKIQKYFRATQQMKKDKNIYLQKKNIIIKLQQRFRASQLMKKTRQMYIKQRKSVILLQQKYRARILMEQARKSYLEQRNAAIKIQQKFRAYLLKKKERKNYLKHREAAIIIQKKFRSYLEMKADRDNYLKLKQATLAIQNRFRANIVMKTVRNNYLKHREAAIIIQKKYRSYLEMKADRNNYLKLKQATVTIQNIFRANIAMKNARNNYLKQKNSVLVIQKKFRANQMMKKQRQNYLKQKNAAIKIQQKFRGNQMMHKERQNYLNQKSAATIIQRRFRAQVAMKMCHKKYVELKRATLYLQNKFRANQMMKKQRQHYLKQKNAAITIQRKFKANQMMNKERQNYLNQKSAATIIQRRFRAQVAMKMCHKKYLELKRAILCLQNKFRANQVMKQIQSNYQKQRNASIIIQRKYRAYVSMKNCRKNYLNLKQATVVIQQRFRANVAMKNARNIYLKQKNSVLVIQRKFRANQMMKKQRQNYLEQKNAAITIQQKFRANQMMQKERQNYLNQKSAATIIQRRFRAQIAMKTCRKKYLQLKRATLYLQNKFRANQAMKRMKSNYQKQRNASIIIQRKYRAYISMKNCRKNYLNLKQAAAVIQQRFRANIEMKNNRKQYLEQKNAAIIIQRNFRAYQLIKKERQNNLQNAAIKIQRKFRATLEMKKCRNIYLNLKNATVFIQQKFRAKQLAKEVQQNYLKQRKAAIIIQQNFRGFMMMKKCRENYLRKKQAAIVIQKRFKANKAMRITRAEYQHQRRTVICIQKYLRSYLKMREYRKSYLELKEATIYVQHKYRANLEMKKCRQNYLERRKAVTIIQNKFRAHLEMKKCRNNYLNVKQATITIQQRFKANLAMKYVRKEYINKKNAAMLIQQRFKAYLQMKICRESYLAQKKAACCIQERLRATLIMKQVRIVYLQQRKAAIIIQNKVRAYLRMKHCRDNYLKLKQSTIFIQRQFRANLATKLFRKNYIQQKQAAICIQRKFRAYLEMKTCYENYLKLKKSACLIQQRFRDYLLVKKQRKEFLLMKEAATKIQRSYRAYHKERSSQELELKIKSVIKIQSWVRMHAAKKQLALLRENIKETEENKEKRRQNNAAVKIQALWRGYNTRKAMSKKMALIRQRSEEAANNASPEFTVGQRNLEAIDLLMFQTSMKEIIRALTILDFTTRLFPNLCIEVCDEITERLYVLLICTNRSVPDMDASILCVSILINLYKFEHTSAAVWKVQYIERLLLLLLHWSDKDSVLFPYVCTLLWLFAQRQEYCEIIKAENNADKILKKTYQQCERRQKMLTRMRNAPIAIHKGQRNVFPSLVPDWGIINVNRPRVFMNPVFAIKCLLKIMKISLEA